MLDKIVIHSILCSMYTIDRGLFSIFNWGASFDDMFMKFWIYMSFCMLNLMKGGD